MSSVRKFALFGSASFGIATVLLGLIMLFVFPASAELSAGFRTPIIAFEFAKTDADLSFLSGNGETSRLNREKMDAGHRWDMVFPFAYAGFVALLLLQLATRGQRWLGLAIPVALLIIPFDIWENTILLALTRALGNAESIEMLLVELNLATWLKWGALGISIAGLAIGYSVEKAYLSALVAVVAAMSVATCWMSGTKPVMTEAMSAAIFLFFFYFSIKSSIQAWKLFSAEGEAHVFVR